MPRLRNANPSTSRNSPLDRVRTRSRSSVGPISGGQNAAADPSRINRRKTRGSGSGEELRRLSRREESLLARVLEKEIDYINADLFHEANAETEIFGLDDVERPDVTWYRPLMEDLIPA